MNERDYTIEVIRAILLGERSITPEYVKKLIEAILSGGTEVIPFEEIYNASLVTLKVIESVRSGERVKI